MFECGGQSEHLLVYRCKEDSYWKTRLAFQLLIELFGQLSKNKNNAKEQAGKVFEQVLHPATQSLIEDVCKVLVKKA